MVSFTLELCVEKPEDIAYAQSEGRKLESEVLRIAPFIQLQILTRVASKIYKVEPFPVQHPGWEVPNENPLIATHQCLLLTQSSLNGHEGLAGPTKGCVDINKAKNAGESSVEIILHEWLHTISHITGINPDDGLNFGCTSIKINGRDYWRMPDGTEWNAWILSKLLP